MADLLHFMAMDDFPNRVNELRRARGLTQQQLADKVGCSKMQVSGIERGKREFSLSMMQRFASVLGVTAGELLHPDDNAFHLDENERFLIEKMRAATPAEREQIHRVTDAILPFRGPEQDAA
jgi:transcriptional regulator with XRE-family HTH domain